jgi:hypothetical protein
LARWWKENLVKERLSRFLARGLSAFALLVVPVAGQTDRIAGKSEVLGANDAQCDTCRRAPGYICFGPGGVMYPDVCDPQDYCPPPPPPAD